MSWLKRLFGKCDDACLDCGCGCGDEKQEMDPIDEPETETPEEPMEGEETPVIE